MEEETWRARSHAEADRTRRCRVPRFSHATSAEMRGSGIAHLQWRLHTRSDLADEGREGKGAMSANSVASAQRSLGASSPFRFTLARNQTEGSFAYRLLRASGSAI